MTSLRILGPVQAWRGDQRLTVGGPRQLTLLAFLVLRANRAVSKDAIIGAVWGPTRSDADNRLQMAIARGRRAPRECAARGYRTIRRRGSSGSPVTTHPHPITADTTGVTDPMRCRP